jgi:hypothetical protein
MDTPGAVVNALPMLLGTLSTSRFAVSSPTLGVGGTKVALDRFADFALAVVVGGHRVSPWCVRVLLYKILAA